MRELVIIGGGPAGMSAAVAAYENGIKDILILERDDSLGGILRQCIHNGFGLHKFKEELTGPEYAYRYEKKVKELNIEFKLNTMVLEITEDKKVIATNSDDGIFEIQAKSIILAMGCRERAKGALNIAGSRPAGVYSAGTAQKLVNMKGYMPGKEIVILGSGDIGLIMARRMTLEGANVKAVCELMPYSSGLARNIQQCLNDFDIPLRLSHTVVKLHGNERLTGVTIAKVDNNRQPIKETYEFIPCDTLLLSCGLIPENELTKGVGATLSPITNGSVVDQNRETNVEGVFSCGNVLHVHDLVDYVSEEAEIAGRSAADYIKGISKKTVNIPISTDGKIRYTVPQLITEEKDVTL
jgi:sarcosine oxidase subunit alpha